MSDDLPPVGPILSVDDVAGGVLQLAALFITPLSMPPAPIHLGEDQIAPVLLRRYGEMGVFRARFAVSANAPSHYGWAGTRYEIASDLSGTLRLAYVSCNGQEHGDLDRDPADRNVMWARLADAHRAAPFSLLLHGGDQIYADALTRAHPLSADWPEIAPGDPGPDAIADLRAALDQAFFAHYQQVYAMPEFAWLAARVPSLAQWDDHDICDGWGSLTDGVTGSAIGQCLFAAARDATLLFQHGCTGGDLPSRFSAPGGQALGWRLSAPELQILAPDLRSERTRQTVMGPEGWALMEDAAAHPAPGRTLLMSSVPLLGPRLSLLETLLPILPRKARDYEDDLRDQWQSHAHRDSWRRVLRLVEAMTEPDAAEVTVLSGEIHLATRATMTMAGGKTLHQLVASGITHPPPPNAWARTLGALAGLGESPLPGHPIRILPLPGQAQRYMAERNFLTLERQGGTWSARWHLEESGDTPALAI